MSIFLKLHDYLIPPAGGDNPQLQSFVPEKYHQPINMAAQKHGLDPKFLSAIINTENREWNEKKPAQTAGETSLGLGQINVATRDYIRKNYKFFMRDKGGESIDAAAWYLNNIKKRIGSDKEEDVALAYNKGVGGFLRGDKNDGYIATMKSFRN